MKLNKLFKKSIWSKLFFMNFLILVAIVVSQLIFQAMYFEKYYLGQKKEALEKNITQFENQLNDNESAENINSYLLNVKKDKGIDLSYKSSDFITLIGLEDYMGDKYILIKDKNTNSEYKVVIGQQFENYNIKNGDNIKVIGDKGKYDYIFPRKILINNVELKQYYEIIPNKDIGSSIAKPAMQISPMKQAECIEGKVLKVVPQNESIKGSNIEFILGNKEIENIAYNNKASGIVKSNNGNGEAIYMSQKFLNGYIIATAPIAQVNEVIGTMNKFYISIFLIALILVIIISLIYSKILTKPLIEMSKIAKKISECDFNHKYKINREDEIGELGKSLNSISENLEKSLGDLKEANIKLKEDMEIKKIQEDKRKELISNISHELKTPITIIQGSINGIKSGIYSTEMYEDILEETNKMNDLVKEMLEVSKLESATFKLNKNPFDLYYILLKEIDKLNPMIREKKLNIKFQENDEIVVFGDEKRINQVVTNLVTNAIKYTPDYGDINITIDLIEETNEYKCSIENFGVTLTEEETKNIWDAFYRTEKSRNKKFGGTGLGLSIVKRILELHNSNYGVRSNANSVKFYFTLERILE